MYLHQLPMKAARALEAKQIVHWPRELIAFAICEAGHATPEWDPPTGTTLVAIWPKHPTKLTPELVEQVLSTANAKALQTKLNKLKANQALKGETR